jgi:hypothetical protein
MMQIQDQTPTFKYTCPGAEARRQVFFYPSHQEPSGSLFLLVSISDDVETTRVSPPRRYYLNFDYRKDVCDA